MSDTRLYDVVIIGGGLAGLAAAIILGRKQYKVLVLEKDAFPRHKVCGEYISMESLPFLEHLGLPLSTMNLPSVDFLQVTDNKGRALDAKLPQGGFGISRFALDAAFAHLAQEAGATVLTKTRAEDIKWEDDHFTIHTRNADFTGKVACGSWGKRSNIDVKWKRAFLQDTNSSLTNHVGIKYHIRYPWPRNTVGLHNFSGGYCGISPIEHDKCCLCYLTTADNLRRSGNDLKRMEQEILMKNPVLYQIFTEAEFLYDAPLAISQISFLKKELVYDHVLLTGDAAGMITPLCGNGMSMALHSAKIASGFIDSFLQNQISRPEMEVAYTAAWKKNFSTRVAIGRFVQNNFGSDHLTTFFLRALKVLPFLQAPLISATSGRAF